MKLGSSLALALAGAFISPLASRAINLDDIQLWSGSGTNRAALVIEWSSPEVFNDTTVPAPLADKCMVWGYRFNGVTNGTAMINAALRADPRLYAVESNSFGAYIVAWGYNLQGNGLSGITDGTNTDDGSTFIGGVLTNESSGIDAAHPVNPGDLYWGGYYGPNWEVWTEQNDEGGFLSSPDRGTNAYWSPDPGYYSGAHGQWSLANFGLDELQLTNGSWIGFSVAAGGDDYLDTNAPGTLAFEMHEHAPISPDGLYFAYIGNSNDFATSIVGSTNLDTSSPYNNSIAVLGPPATQFLDYFGTDSDDLVKIIEPPYWTTTNGSDVITEILADGEITVKLGRKVYDDPNNPFGIDLIVYGNSFFSVSGLTSSVGNDTDLNTAILGSGYYGHNTAVSVSQDGSTWHTFTNEAELFPDNAYRWDDNNAIWTAEQMNPTKPLNPSTTGSLLGGLTVANALDQFVGAAGGTGYNLKESGLPWIQYVRVAPAPGSYTVIDAIAAVRPTVVGDALAITPTNIASGLTTLAFADPAVSNLVAVSLSFGAISASTRISTVKLFDFSPFASVRGDRLSAFQITAKSEDGTNAVNLSANAKLQVGANYVGDGSDLRVWQWNQSAWSLLSFQYNSADNTVALSGLTNLGAFVVSQYVRPTLAIAPGTNGFSFPFNAQGNITYTLERAASLDASAQWTVVDSFTPTNAQTTTLHDSAPSQTNAFYRLELTP